jgi:hypothetical protein
VDALPGRAGADRGGDDGHVLGAAAGTLGLAREQLDVVVQTKRRGSL